MSRYAKYVKNRPFYSLKGGPFSRWRYSFARALYRKREEAGPEPLRHRSVWVNWNYESEIFAFGSRLNEKFDENLLKQALTHPSYIELQKANLEEVELSEQQLTAASNTELAKEGENICKYYIRVILQFWYPKFPNEGIDAITNYLMSSSILSNVSRNLGLTDLIKTEDFPVKDETHQTCLCAVISALSRSSGVVRAHLFINDFILTQLIGKNINEIWSITNPMGLLIKELEKEGIDKKLLVPRLLWSTGSASLTGTYQVGLYIDQNLFSKGSGETADIAEEMAARDALRRIYGTTEDAPSLPYGDKARKYCEVINKLYETFQKSNITQSKTNY